MVGGKPFRCGSGGEGENRRVSFELTSESKNKRFCVSNERELKGGRGLGVGGGGGRGVGRYCPPSSLKTPFIIAIDFGATH